MKKYISLAALFLTVTLVTGCGTTTPNRARPQMASSQPSGPSVWDVDVSKPISASQFYGALKSAGLGREPGI